MEVIHFIKYKDRPNDRAVGEGAYVFSLAFLPPATRVHRSFPLRALAKE